MFLPRVPVNWGFACLLNLNRLQTNIQIYRGIWFPFSSQSRLFLVFIVIFLPKCYQLTRLCSSEEFFKLLLSFTSASNTDIGKQVVHLLLLDGARFWHRTPPTAKSLFPAEAHNPKSQRGAGGAVWAEGSEKPLQSVGCG